MTMTGCGDGMPPSGNAFQFLTPEELAVLVHVVTPVVVEKGGRLFCAGDASSGVYFLETGRLAVLKETGFNDRTQVVALLEPGASVGEAGVLDNMTHAATIVAIEDSRLHHLGCEGLATLGEKAPLLLLKIMRRLLYVANLRLRKSSERLAHIL